MEGLVQALGGNSENSTVLNELCVSQGCMGTMNRYDFIDLRDGANFMDLFETVQVDCPSFCS